MRKSSPKLSLSAVLVVTCLVLGVWACGGGGGSSPTEPSPPVMDISGRYGGGHNAEITSNCGCSPFSWPEYDALKTEWDIWQNHSILEGSYFIEWPESLWLPESTRCDFSGTLSGTVIAASNAGCDDEAYLMECANGSSRKMVLTSLDWDSRVQGDQTIYGEWSGTWDCFDPANGQSLGVFTLTGDTYMARH